MKLSNLQTQTTSNETELLDDPWVIAAFGAPLPVAAGTIQITQKTWDRQVEWFDYPRWLLCRLHLIHRPHCHVHSAPIWAWREPKEYREERKQNQDQRRWWASGPEVMHYWDPRDWWFWFVRDCNHCDYQDCLNYNDC